MGLENLADPPGTAMDGLAGSIQRLRGIAEPAVLEHLPDIEKFLGKLDAYAVDIDFEPYLLGAIAGHICSTGAVFELVYHLVLVEESTHSVAYKLINGIPGHVEITFSGVLFFDEVSDLAHHHADDEVLPAPSAGVELLYPLIEVDQHVLFQVFLVADGVAEVAAEIAHIALDALSREVIEDIASSP